MVKNNSNSNNLTIFVTRYGLKQDIEVPTQNREITDSNRAEQSNLKFQRSYLNAAFLVYVYGNLSTNNQLKSIFQFFFKNI